MGSSNSSAVSPLSSAVPRHSASALSPKRQRKTGATGFVFLERQHERTRGALKSLGIRTSVVASMDQAHRAIISATR